MNPKVILFCLISKGNNSLQIILFIFGPSLLYGQTWSWGADNLDAGKEKKKRKM